MLPLDELFPHHAAIDVANPASRLNWPDIPAKAAVYLLTAESPVLLATVGDLRSALQRRLADTPADVKSKRVEYGRISTQVHWRIVHSPFAANLWYQQAAQTLFPATSKALIPWRNAWWIAVERPDIGAPFPRFRKTSDLSDPSLAYVGPVRDKHAAQRLIETVEDLFDLCRFYNILIQSPHGKACTYKEMGKCPAPCDGTIPLSAYHQQIRAALNFVADLDGGRADWFTQLQSVMRSASAQLRFEEASKIKQRLDRASALTNEAFAHLAALEDFSYLALQPGQGKPYIEPFLIHAGAIQCLPQFHKKNLSTAVTALFETCRSLRTTKSIPANIISPAANSNVALLAHHLFRVDPGIYLRIRDLLARGPDLILEAANQLLQRKAAPKPLPELATDTLPNDSPTSSAQ